MGKFSANVGFVASKQGILKSLQLILSIVCVSLIASYTTLLAIPEVPEEIKLSEIIVLTRFQLFYYLTSVTFLISTALEIISCIGSKSTALAFAASSHEVFANFTACALFFSAGVMILYETCKNYTYPDVEANELTIKTYRILISAGSMALVNALLYIANVAVGFSAKET